MTRVNNFRDFDGKRYELYEWTTSKVNADKIANRIRDGGKLARILHHGGDFYYVYYR